MKYNNVEEKELYSMVCESNEEVQKKLYEYCEPQINYMIKKYLNVALKCGIDPKDFEQEALLAYTNALKNFDETKDAGLKTFVSLCVERRLMKVINATKRYKNQINKENLSLEYQYHDSGVYLKDILADNESDPLVKYSEEEYLEQIKTKIKYVLSEFEYQVFEYLIEGLNYIEIAKILDKNPKQIDNTIQRIKKKIKIIVKEDEDESQV